jgi:hypothetical protein
MNRPNDCWRLYGKSMNFVVDKDGELLEILFSMEAFNAVEII